MLTEKMKDDWPAVAVRRIFFFNVRIYEKVFQKYIVSYQNMYNLQQKSLKKSWRFWYKFRQILVENFVFLVGDYGFLRAI